ncbi:MAG TPA: 1,2-phenylacetyl-CoA epoxidase subunit PaaA [Symbiobacteriaceae bacterium]|nr:1,2-phenylacetyl-CoA epoxidase subunit PaaA [Symbiobacteriaceae bacterium]
MTEAEKLEQFMARIERGEKIEATDWMPDEYRLYLVRFMQMHALSEIMGALPEKEWVPRAPTLARKLSLMAKVQDEMGHGQLILRIAEDLAVPLGKTREDLVNELFTGEAKFHNVFHMPAPTWADCGIIGWLVDGAAVVSQAALLDSSYGPYARVLQRVCAEEGFHIQHGESICLALAEGTPEQRQSLQEALERWWESLLLFFGPADTTSTSAQVLLKYRFRTKTNEELRQKFFAKYVPRIHSLGLQIPDPDFHWDEAAGLYRYTPPDWSKLKLIARNQGPLSQERLGLRRLSYEQGEWVRAALMAGAQSAS